MELSIPKLKSLIFSKAFFLFISGGNFLASSPKNQKFLMFLQKNSPDISG